MAKETITIEGTMYWNSCAQEATYEGQGLGKFKFDLSNLSEEVVDLIKKFAPLQTIKSKEAQPERGNFVTVSQSMKFVPRACVDGVAYMPFEDKDGNPMSKAEVATIGNGSKILVVLGSYGGGRLSFEGGRVLDLLEYVVDNPLDQGPTVPNRELVDLDDSIPF